MSIIQTDRRHLFKQIDMTENYQKLRLMVIIQQILIVLSTTLHLLSVVPTVPSITRNMTKHIRSPVPILTRVSRVPEKIF